MVLEFNGTILPDGHINVPSEFAVKMSTIKNFKVIILTENESFNEREYALQKLKALKGAAKWEGDLDEMREGRNL